MCSDRRSNSRSSPTIDGQQDCVVQQSESSINEKGIVTITYQRRIDTGDADDDLVIADAKQKFIWAYSATPPSDPNDPASAIGQHSPENRGVIEVNLLGGAGEVGGETSAINQAFVLHGVAMMAAWLFFGPLGYVLTYAFIQVVT